MIIDDKWEVSDAQSMIASPGAICSEDVIDLAATQQDGFFATVTTTRIGEQAKPPVLVCTVATALVGSGATIVATIASKASSASISSGGTTHATFTIAEAAAAGTQYVVPLPWDAYNRYLGVVYTVTGAALTAGAVDAHFVEAGELTD
jgi:hypothetical protein